MPSLPSAPIVGERASPLTVQTTALDQRIYTMSRKNSCHPVREHVARCRHRSAHCRTGAIRPSSGSSAYARWSSSGPRCRWSSSRSGRRRSSPRWSFRPDLSLAFRPVAARAHLRVSSVVSTVLADCMASSAAARPIFVASRVAPRPTALRLEIVTPAMAMAVATGTLMRRGDGGLRLWQSRCLFRRRLLLRLRIQAIRHQACSGLS